MLDPAKREEARKRATEWRKANIERARDADYKKHIRRKFGLTLEDYQRMYTAQAGLCAICQKSSAIKRHRLHIDHNHRTHTVRALLCHHCNAGIGCFFESTELLGAAIQYLQDHK